MINTNEECVEFDEKRKKIVMEELGKSYILNNRSELRIRGIRIDDCLIKNPFERCDFMLDIFSSPKKRAILVELQGRKTIYKGISQLISTINILNVDLKDKVLDARIICGGVPRLEPSNKPKLLKILKDSGGSLKIKTNSYEETI